MPQRDRETAGPPPPPPPRELPKEFIRRAQHVSKFELLFGSIFGGVGVFLGLIFFVIGLTTFIWLFALIGLVIGAIFGGIGGAVLYAGRRRSRNLLQVLSQGEVTTGEIDAVALDYSVRVNQRHPWRIGYFFTVAGVRHAGSGRAWTADETLQPGAPVHVVYLAMDPGRNSIYPPLA